jgi:anti-sigma factor RsiW
MITGLNVFGCHNCQRRLDAYLDQRLPPRQRRWVARHLDTCPACYAACIERRELRRELQRSLPLVGKSHTPDFGAIWGAVQAELPRHEPPPPYRMRYGLALLALIIVFLLPLTGAGREARAALPPTHPAPVVASTQSPEITEAVVVATSTALVTHESNLTTLSSPPTLPEPATQTPPARFEWQQ